MSKAREVYEGMVDTDGDVFGIIDRIVEHRREIEELELPHNMSDIILSLLEDSLDGMDDAEENLLAATAKLAEIVEKDEPMDDQKEYAKMREKVVGAYTRLDKVCKEIKVYRDQLKVVDTPILEKSSIETSLNATMRYIEEALFKFDPAIHTLGKPSKHPRSDFFPYEE